MALVKSIPFFRFLTETNQLGLFIYWSAKLKASDWKPAFAKRNIICRKDIPVHKLTGLFLSCYIIDIRSDYIRRILGLNGKIGRRGADNLIQIGDQGGVEGAATGSTVRFAQTGWLGRNSDEIRFPLEIFAFWCQTAISLLTIRADIIQCIRAETIWLESRLYQGCSCSNYYW